MKVRVTDNIVWLVERYVDEGQAVSPGDKLMAVMALDGVIREIEAEDFGVVGHIEGKKIRRRRFGDMSDSKTDLRTDDGSDLIRYNGGLGSVYRQNDLLCQIVKRTDRNSIKGGKPHPSTSRSISNAKAEGRLLPTFG